jgi:hypothetical protein
MLMIQLMQGYEDKLRERNRLKGTGWHCMVANGPESEWQVGPLSGLKE